jgi:hypothetical protein
MAIATRDWEEAVEQIEKGELQPSFVCLRDTADCTGEELLKIAAPNASALTLLTTRMKHLRPTLITSLAADLAYPDIRKSETIRLIHLLVRLGQGQKARDSFLGARKESMLHLVRAIRAEGDISLYISELAVVCFTVIRNTGDWYMTSFKENGMASGELRWTCCTTILAELIRQASSLGQSNKLSSLPRCSGGKYTRRTSPTKSPRNVSGSLHLTIVK